MYYSNTLYSPIHQDELLLLDAESPLDSSKRKIELNSNTSHPSGQLQFGANFTPHMLEVNWDKTLGWSVPIISPFSNLSIHPASTSLHYALQVFEGLKGFKLLDNSSTINLFRPDMHIERLYRSCERLCLPTFDKKELLQLIVNLVQLEAAFVPSGRGKSIYIRPFIFSTEPTLGISPPGKAKLVVICSPVGSYFINEFKPVWLLADTQYTRTWPGGAGEAKCGGYFLHDK